MTVRPRRNRLDMDGLVRRMSLGFGSFVTRDEMETRPQARITDLLRSTPGVEVYVNQKEHTYFLYVRGKTCVPDVFVDGVRQMDPPSELDIPPATDLEAVEIYRGIAEIPGRYILAKPTPQCAVVAVWTGAKRRLLGRSASGSHPEQHP